MSGILLIIGLYVKEVINGLKDRLGRPRKASIEESIIETDPLGYSIEY